MHERIKNSNLVKVELVSWFLNDMNVEGRLRLIFHPLEVSIGGVIGIGTKSILEETGEGFESMWLVGEDEVTVFFDIHRVVQGDLLWGIVLIDDLCSDITDVLAVVVDVLFWSTTMFQDVVVVTVVNDKNTAWLQHANKVLEALFMIPEITVIIKKMGKRISHAKNSIESTNWFPNILGKSQPVGLFYLPIKEGWLSTPVPPGLVSSLQHLIGSIRRGEGVALLDEHHRVYTCTTSRIQNAFYFLLLQQIQEKSFVVQSAAILLSNIQLPVLCCLSIGILVSNAGCSDPRRLGD